MNPCFLPPPRQDNRELDDFRRRFYISLPLVIVLFAISMGGHIAAWLNPGVQNWVELLLAAPVVLWGGQAAADPWLGIR